MALFDGKTKDIVKLFFELGQLKRSKRTGWWLAKIEDPESVAEHSHRVAALAYVLAKMEKSPKAKEIALAALFHDALETRLVDVHKVHSNYLKTPKDVERRIVADQRALMPKDAADELNAIDASFGPVERAILKDADYLEMAFQGKEYYDTGYHCAVDWIENVGAVLKTKSAKRLWSEMRKTDSGIWFKGLKESIESIKKHNY